MSLKTKLKTSVGTLCEAAPDVDEIKKWMDETKGKMPDTWLCVDCGFNTGPGLSSRVEVALTFASGKSSFEDRYGNDTEVYMVSNKVWDASGIKPMGGCLCIGCLEKRIGRRLKPKDFPRNHPFHTLPGTKRLLDRRGR